MKYAPLALILLVGLWGCNPGSSGGPISPQENWVTVWTFEDTSDIYYNLYEGFISFNPTGSISVTLLDEDNSVFLLRITDWFDLRLAAEAQLRIGVDVNFLTDGNNYLQISIEDYIEDEYVLLDTFHLDCADYHIMTVDLNYLCTTMEYNTFFIDMFLHGDPLVAGESIRFTIDQLYIRAHE